ncbi:MAG: sigma-70 family RNA polymerase sigma factor [Geminocystis sp.]|nr:sigma-70 family RNA polymerase sigma factor [Geminocystis sp.]HIK37825.1 sigma-70 family RNA polymerase sigma factor [Geminocystis sp. M7585_C2015_104]MCS7148712.1 sigma-70 family RNA polymerase sigma factor [Geminocystis sp.]MCX8078414.1 sigma-70 family RNA polymerase sigma factor [Geminocystis sp.]MDW8116139.1 sigma-70 family RNA polymerase sigma factor [Geminocystis sp.]
MLLSISLSWSSLAIPISPRVRVEQLSNTDLILLCQEGKQPDRVAFTELLRRYQGYVDKILYNLAPDWPDRGDLAQEVWLRVYKKIHSLQDPTKFKSWLGRLVTNLFYDQLRKRKKYSESLSLDSPITEDDEEYQWDLPSQLPNPEEALSTAEFYEHLQRAIANLPETFRVTIVLREIQGLSYEEIAEITQVSLGTVKSRIARARHRLQSLLKPYLDSR